MIGRILAFYRLQLRLVWEWRPGRRALIRRGIVSFLVGMASLWFAIWIMPGITARDGWAVAAGVIVLALLNLLVRPLLIGVTAAFSPIVLAIATLLFQVVAFLIMGSILPGLDVEGFVPAFIGSWIYAIINTVLTAILATDNDESYWGALVRQLALRREGVIRTDAPGVVIIQIDGLAHPILAHQIRAGRVPFISRWVRSGQMRLDRWTALLPSQTSASQAGILHGNNSFIPAFRWWEKDSQRMLVSNHPDDATEIVRRASDGEGLLSNDGASVGNLVSGDAVRSYITMATIKDKGQGLGRSQTFTAFFASPYNYLHTVVLTVAEVIKEYYQARRSHRRGIEPSMHRGMPYPVARAGTNVALRSLSTSLVMEEMYRGTPVIYVDYTDYDEIAHHSGPERGETLDALDGVDSVIESLVRASEEAPRPYRFVLLSDHGQSLGATFKQRYGRTLQEVIADLMGGAVLAQAAVAPGDSWGPLNAALSEAGQTEGATGALTRAVTKGSMRDGAVDLGEATAERAVSAQGPEGAPGGEEVPELVVAASGNLALVFFPRVAGRVTLEDMERRWPGLVPSLARHEGIGFVMVRSESHGAVALGATGARYLDEDRVEGSDPVAKYGEHAVTGLRRVDAMEHCGDLVVISLLDEATDEVAAFEELIGSHGGLGGAQTRPFILHPADWSIDEPIVGAEAVYRQLRRWLGSVGIDLSKEARTRPTEETR
jgi:uncharacterized membrane protein YvlD (DUF360 family)